MGQKRGAGAAGNQGEGRGPGRAEGVGLTPAGAGEAAASASVEEALRRLEELAKRLEEGDLDLQTSLALYREARQLHASCVRALTAAEEELQILLADDRLVPEKLGAEEEGNEG